MKRRGMAIYWRQLYLFSENEAGLKGMAAKKVVKTDERVGRGCGNSIASQSHARGNSYEPSTNEAGPLMRRFYIRSKSTNVSRSFPVRRSAVSSTESGYGSKLAVSSSDFTGGMYGAGS